MTFYKHFGHPEKERKVTIEIPHGTVIGMSREREVAGAAGTPYWHCVDGCTGTYSLGLQLRAGKQNEVGGE